MTGIGGPRWLEQQSKRLATLTVDPSVRIVLQQVMDDDTQLSWHIIVADGAARLVAGSHPRPDVTLTVDPTTAEAIAVGRTSPQREFLDGRIRIGGDIAALMQARGALAVLLAAPQRPT